MKSFKEFVTENDREHSVHHYDEHGKNIKTDITKNRRAASAKLHKSKAHSVYMHDKEGNVVKKREGHGGVVREASSFVSETIEVGHKVKISNHVSHDGKEGEVTHIERDKMGKLYHVMLPGRKKPEHLARDQIKKV